MAQTVRPASGISRASVVPGGGASHVGGSTPVQRPPMTAAEEEARRKPPAAAAVNPSRLPWDSIAEGKAANADLTYNNVAGVGGQIQANEELGQKEFGLDESAKDNPYSRAAVLQHNHESAARGIYTTAGQAGYSGQTGNAQGAEQGRFNQGHQALVGEQERAKANWEAERQAAVVADKEAHNEAQEGAVERASSQPGPEVPLKEKASHPSQSPPQGKKWAYNAENNRWHLVKA